MRSKYNSLLPRDIDTDNYRLANYLQEAGFYKEREISLPHKQSNLFKINRDVWRAPAL
jgi:hypothetical protein